MIKTEEDYALEKILSKYKAALQILETKFNIMYEEYQNRDICNPIEHIKGRIKTKHSIYEKLITDGYEINLYNVEKNIHDVAGIRIVCTSLDDVYKIEDNIKMMEENETIKILDRKDYILDPKSSGYRSLHLKVLVPVEIIDKVEYVRAEIQIRSIAMDMWASLEHKLCYKTPEEELSPSTIKGSKNFAITTKRIDELMNKMIISSKNNTNFTTPKIKDQQGLLEIMEMPMLKYQLAQNIVMTKINALNSLFKESGETNPIEHIKTRIKPPTSICQKLEKNNYQVNIDNMKKHIHDTVGVRIVCSFLSDLEIIKNIILNDLNLEVVRVKDYISNPKPNGYRSYHLNVLVPVNMLDKIEFVEVEIQIRTIAMDMWASLEHVLCYKKEGNEPKNIKENLQKTSQIVIEVDNRLNNLVRNNEDKKTNKTLKRKFPNN